MTIVCRVCQGSLKRIETKKALKKRSRPHTIDEETVSIVSVSVDCLFFVQDD
jgi:hypothetical protein